MKHLRKICLTTLPLIGLALGAAKLGLVPRGTPLDTFAPEASFIRHRHSALRSCSDFTSAKRIAATNKEGGDVVGLADGTWVAVVMEHSCCTGAGFNATLYVTSSGAAYLDSSSCYCAWPALGDELVGHAKDSKEAFFASVKASGKTLTQR